MNDIAEKAGVSRPTVSVVLSQRGDAIGISTETRQRVLDAAAELGYRRNALASAVGTGKNRMVGFLAIAPQVEFVAQMMVGALGEAERQNFTLKILRMHNNIVDREVIDRCVELRLAGVVTVHVNHEPSLSYLHDEMTRHNIPLAILDSSFPHPWGIRVISDDEVGAAEATTHLIRLGHRRIAFVGGLPDSGSSVQRETGYRRAMADAGLAIRPDDVQSGDWDAGVTERVTRTWLSRSAQEAPTAIFCASDSMAMVVTRTARRMGFQLPEDLSVIGYGNLPRTELCDPPLTTVEQPFSLMGIIGVRSLLERVEHRPEQGIDAPVEHTLETRLVVRESTCAPA